MVMSFFSRSGFFFKPSLWLVAAFFLLNSGVQAQETYYLKTTATSVLVERAQELVKEDNPEELLRYLEELLIRIGDNTGKEFEEMRSFCLYQIGICRLQMGQYDEARASFDRFRDEFPNDSLMPRAVLFAAECAAMEQDWPVVETYTRSLDDVKAMDPERRLSADQLLAEALFQQEKWAEATDVLLKVFESAGEAEVRARAAVMLAACYARLGDIGKMSGFLSECGDLRYQSRDLSIALLEVADEKAKEEDYLDALYLYRQVMWKDELVRQFEQRMSELKPELEKRFTGGIGKTRSSFDEKQRKVQREYTRLEEGLKKLRDAPAHDTHIALRIGMCYAGLKRNVPAFTLLRSIYTEHPGHELAEDAYFQAFAVALDMQNWADAVEVGSVYIARYSNGRFIDEMTLNLMQVYLQNGRIDEALALGKTALDLSPNHRFMDQVKYLLGYLHFQKLDYNLALPLFKEVSEKWPGSIYAEGCEYWVAMCHLFMARFDLAADGFKAYLNNQAYSQKAFAEDASYRLGIAQYGLGDFKAAESTFLNFINTYPGSYLESEAYSMLGDLRGAEGDLDIALKFYDLGYQTAVTVEQVNYALFQSAAVYELEKQYEKIISVMEKYLAEWGERSNYAGAGFWMGKAYKALGQYPKALSTYIETVVKFGDNIENNDVDLILRELIKEQESEEGRENRLSMMQRLQSELQSARQRGAATLALRLETLLAGITEGTERKRYVDSILADGQLESAGPLTLLLVAREAQARGDSRKVHEVYQKCMDRFAESDILVDVMNIELQARLNEKNYDGVIELAEEITNRFGYREEVGLTRKLKADACRLTGKIDEAIATYTELFAVSEWRGPLTPEALYWIGACHLEQGNPEQAFAFFQRIYVLYEGYTGWAAKAYEASIDCLRKIGKPEEDVIRTYREMLANEKIAATPEGQRARAALEKLAPEGDM